MSESETNKSKKEENSKQNQPINELVPDSEPCEEFPTQICFELRFNDREIVRRGFCQLSLRSFRQLYEILRKHITLPELSAEP